MGMEIKPYLTLPEEQSLRTLAKAAEPISRYVDGYKPHIAVGIDRGGRLLAGAVYRFHQEDTHERFPTVDHMLHFVRITNNNDDEVSQAAIDKTTHQIEELLKNVRRHSHSPLPEQLRFLFIDDWIRRGRTKILISHALKNLEIFDSSIVKVATMIDTTGTADISSLRSASGISLLWNNNPAFSGIDYSSGHAKPIRDQKALLIKRTVSTQAKQYAERLAKDR